MTDIIIPNLGNEISEAEITEWLVGAGEEVEEGDVVLLISTTKTALEIEAPVSGKISQIILFLSLFLIYQVLLLDN